MATASINPAGCSGRWPAASLWGVAILWATAISWAAATPMCSGERMGCSDPARFPEDTRLKLAATRSESMRGSIGLLFGF